MGYYRHNAIVVGSSLRENIINAYLGVGLIITSYAIKEGSSITLDMLSPISNPILNDYTFFTVYPDGSKEGWLESNIGDEMREEIKNYLDTAGVSWGEIGFEE